MTRAAWLFAVSALCALPTGAQAPAREMTFAEYLAEVARANLDLAAQRAGATAAEAQIEIARILPDPALTVLGQYDPSGDSSAAFGLGLSQTIELGGKRSGRVSSAEGDAAAARAGLDDFLRTLRGSAANLFIDALSARLVLQRKEQTLAALERLVRVNETRLTAGDIGESALLQSRVEARRFQGEVLAARAEVRAADIALAQPIARFSTEGAPLPKGALALSPRRFQADRVSAVAVRDRADVVQRRFALKAASARVELARANRWTDLTLGLGVLHNFNSTGPAGNPPYNSLNALLGFPIPLGRQLHPGELAAAVAGMQQAEAQLRASELRVDVEVRQAVARYDASVERVQLYTSGVLSDADKVLESTLYNYQRGGATLLEVLDAQRTDDDVYLAYSGALADHSRALVAVELAAGIWDVQF